MNKYLIFFIGYFLLSNESIAQNKLTSAMLSNLDSRCLGSARMSGRITSIEGINKSPRVIYVGTAGGGVWKTTDAGANFNAIFDKHCQSIGAIAIDQQHPDTIWVGTGESNMRNSVSVGNGIYKSTDGGDNWLCMGLEKTEHISKVLVHPKNPNTIFVAAPGALWSDSADRGLYKTTDGGKTWEKALYINEKTGCSEIMMNPNNPDELYACTWEFRRKPFSFNSGGEGSGIYKSTDGGKTWNKLTKGLPTGNFGRVALAIAPTNAKKLIAIVESQKTELYISEDAGETWAQQSKGANRDVTARPFYFSTLVIDPNDEMRVYRPAYNFSLSTDGGYSFETPSYYGGGVHPDHHALWINPQNTNMLYLGTDGGVYVSLNKGYNWTYLHNLPVSQFYHVAIDNQKPYNIYGGLQDNGSWMAPSRKAGGIGNQDWKELNWGDGFWVQPDLSDPNIVYAESQGGNMNRVEKDKMIATDIQPYPLAGEDKMRWNWNTPIVPSPTNPKVLYTGSQYLYRTENKGTTWKRISGDLTTNDKAKQKQEESGGLTADNSSAENHCTIFTIAESPLDANMIWVGTDDGNLQLTTDGGKTWNNMAANYEKAGIPKGTWVSSIEPSRFNKSTLYVTFDNHTYGDMKTYAAVSTDAGKTWKMFTNSDFTGFAHKIKEDIKSQNLLWLGTEMGLFLSLDAGKNWTRVKTYALPAYALVRDIVIDKETNDVILATHGRGIIILDNANILRLLDEKVLANDVTVLPSPTAYQTNGIYGGGRGNAGEFAAWNPDERAQIYYFMKNRLTSGKVSIEIYDKAGKMMYEIPGTNRRGLNNVGWNMQMKPPKTARTGAGLDGSGFTAPLVETGDYKFVLKVADKKYEGKVTVVPDSRINLSKEEYALKQKTISELYNMVSELAFVTQQVVHLQEQMAALKGNTKAEALTKEVSTYADSLEVTRKKLVNTKEGTGITGEEQLREKLAGIYQTVVYTVGRPTDAHLDRVKGIRFEIDKVKKKLADFETLHLTKINTLLKTENLKSLEKLTQEGFDKM